MLNAESEFRSVITRYHQAMLSKDADLLAELYDVDAIHEFPFTHEPQIRLRGREAVRERYKAAWGATTIVVEDIVNVVTRLLMDPEMVLCEFDMLLRDAPTESTFTASSILIMRVKDGRLVHVRDYVDALTIAQALGKVPLAP